MQIYGILLRFRGIFTENTWKTVEKQRKIVEFPRNSFLNLYLDDPFSRSFPVVSGRFSGHSWRKSENFGEKQRKMENLVEFSGIFTEIIPFYSISLHFLSPIPRFYALQHVFETILSEE